MSMKGNLFDFELLLLLVLMNGCSVSKFDYKTAYRFSYYNYQKEKPSYHHSPSLIASTEHAIYQLSSKAISEGLNPAIPDASTISNLIPVTENFPSSLSKAEKRAFRKVVRNKFKEIRSEYRKELQSEKETNQNAKKNWTAIAGVAAGVLSAIGILTTVSALFWFWIPGLVFSIIGLKSEKKSWAVFGLVLNIVIVVLTLIAIIIFVSDGFSFGL